MTGPRATVESGFLAKLTLGSLLTVLALLNAPARELKGSSDQVVVLIDQKQAIAHYSGDAHLIRHFDPVVVVSVSIRAYDIVAVHSEVRCRAYDTGRAPVPASMK